MPVKSPLHRYLLFAVTAILVLPACRKSTPVVEVSVGDSGIAIQSRDVAEIQTPWPQWRGPGAAGRVGEVDVPTVWSESENLVWQSDVPGRGHGSPIVVGDQVILATADDEQQKQSLVAYQIETGEPVWSRVIHEGNFPARSEVHQKATNANGTPASDGRLIVTAFLNQERIFVTAVDLQGETLWQTDIGAFGSKFGYAPSPVFYQSFVIVAADNFGGGYLVALDSQSGEIAWRRGRGNASSYSSPMVANVGGTDQVLITGGDRLASYDPATGEPNWETPCIAEATCGTVITSGDRIVASGGYPNKETVCVSATGEKIWSDRTKVYEPSLATDGQNVFAVTDNGVAMCWALEDGRVQWKERLGGNFSSSPLIVGDRVYVADLSGNTYVFSATGDGFNLIAKNRLGSDCYASPAIAMDSLFLRIGFGDGGERKEKLVRISNET